MTEHTPGPWQWVDEPTWLYALRGPRGWPDVISLSGGNEDEDPNIMVKDADRRLIAAAPDMLAELRRLHDKYGHQSTADVIDKATAENIPISRLGISGHPPGSGVVVVVGFGGSNACSDEKP